MKPIERIILALDVSDYNEAVEMVSNFKDHIEIFKVGSELFTSAGPKIIETIHSIQLPQWIMPLQGLLDCETVPSCDHF